MWNILSPDVTTILPNAHDIFEKWGATSVVVNDLRLKDEDKDKESSFKDKDKDLMSKDENKDDDLKIGLRGSSRTRTFLPDKNTGGHTLTPDSPLDDCAKLQSEIVK